MPTQTDLDNAVAAYRDAKERSEKATADVMHNLELAQATGKTGDNDSFMKAARSALHASEEHNKAAQLAVKVLFEIGQLKPHLKPSNIPDHS